jgi:hypothetical protein
MGEPRVGQGPQCLVEVAGKPRAMAELDRDRPARQPGRQRGKIIEPGRVEMDPRRELEEHIAELAGLGDRPHSGPEQVKRPIDGLR